MDENRGWSISARESMEFQSISLVQAQPPLRQETDFNGVWHPFVVKSGNRWFCGPIAIRLPPEIWVLALLIASCVTKRNKCDGWETNMGDPWGLQTFSIGIQPGGLHFANTGGDDKIHHMVGILPKFLWDPYPE